jgi:mannosyltransferase OCH1-like enzyme
VEKFFQSEFYKLSLFQEGFEENIRSVDAWNELARRFELWKARAPECENRIPRKIHQIWIGKALPEKYKAFCESWKEYNPAYEYFLWDEKAILDLEDFESRDAFRSARSLGAKSDIARYEILRRFGGIYADTDFECVKAFDELVDRCSFFAGNLYDTKPYLCNAIIASAPGHWLLQELCRKTRERITTTELMDIIEATGPGLLTREVIGHLAELGDNDIVFPSACFYPYPNYISSAGTAKEIKESFITREAYAIHYWEVSWSKVDFFSYVIRKTNRAIKKLRKLARKR